MKKQQAWIVEVEWNFMEHSAWIPYNELPPFQGYEIAEAWRENEQKKYPKAKYRVARYVREIL